MGQYFKPIIGHNENGKFVCDAFVHPHEYDNGLKLMEHSYIGNAVVGAIENLLNGKYKGSLLVWAGDYAGNEKDSEGNLYDLLYENTRLNMTNVPKKHFRFAVNETKKEYVDTDKVKADSYGYKIHPVPLLCAEGNGSGSGDYYGTNMKFVGTWARDVITFSDEQPADYKEIEPQFEEK